MKVSDLLNISDRHFRRLLKAYNKHEPSGLISKKEASQAIINCQKKIFTQSIFPPSGKGYYKLLIKGDY